MELFVITFVAFLLMGLALALGMLFGRQGVQGSCGGLNRIPGLEDSCGSCAKKRCPRKKNSNTKT